MPPSFPERLETPRLILTRPAEADLPDLRAMHTDQRVMATLGGPYTADEIDGMHARLFAAWERDGLGWWVLRDRRDGRFVGRGGLRRCKVEGTDETEVGYGLAHDFWGRGLATELARAAVGCGFAVLGLPDVVSFTLPTNAASRRVMEKTGLRYERGIEHAGLPHVLYRLRRENWVGNDE